MSDPTPEEVRASIIPKSDQINTDDLITGPLTVTIEGVSKGDREQPIIVSLEGHRPYKPCKTMRRVLISVFSDDPKKWSGERMTLYCDPEVTWAGVKVGGIRISHLSGITEPRTFLLTQARGKKVEIVIRPLAEPMSVEDESYVTNTKSEIKNATSLSDLKAIGVVLKSKSTAVRDALRPDYERKQSELK